jgi:tetratricopeptide (TPR) repeat protein
MDAARIADGLRHMQRDPATPLSPALAREVAEREGVKAVVTGEIDPVGQGYVLVASVVSAGDGAVLTGVREAASDAAALIPALDRLSRALRERIGESLTTIRATEPLEQVTTRSLEALQKYTQAVRHDLGGDYDGEIALLEQATALDTGFAMAYRKLAVMLNNTGGSTDQMVAAATHAFTHRDRLPALERDHAAAYYYWSVDYQPAQAIALYRDVLALDPNDYIALNNLSLLLMRQREWSAAESLATRGAATGRCGSPCYLNMVSAQVFQGQYGAAQATIDRFARATPHDPLVFMLRALLAGAQHDYAASERFERQLRAEQQAIPAWQEQTSYALAMVALVQGQLTLAEQHVRDAMSAAERRGVNAHYLSGAIGLGYIDLLFRDRPPAGLQQVAAALARHPLDSLRPVDRPYTTLAGFYARAGRRDEARRLLAEYERVVPVGLRHVNVAGYSAEGDLAAAEGRLRDARAAYEAWRDASGCIECGLFEEAQVEERLGAADSALALYERLVAANSPYRLLNSDPAYLAATYKRLGELYDARHDRGKARDYYGRFVSLWKAADPELQPVVRDVRARIARLAAEP